MANTKAKLESVKFEDLAEGTWYDVKKTGFNIVESKKNKGTKFVSYWLVITNGTDTKITSITGAKADKAMAITFNCKITDADCKNGLNIKKIRRVVRNNYDDVQFVIEPWTQSNSEKSEDVPF